MNSVHVVRVKLERTGQTIGKLEGPESAVKIFREQIGDRDREVFAVLHLDTKNQVSSYEEVSIGSVNAAIVTPREVFKAAIMSNASSIIMAHLHPTGNTDPSNEDKMITTQLAEAGVILGIKVFDHLIIGDGHFSFKENGLL